MIEIIKLEKNDCSPCQFVDMSLEVVMSEAVSNFVLTKVNVEDNPEIAASYEIMSVPVVVIKKDGKETHRFAGKTLPAPILMALEELK